MIILAVFFAACFVRINAFGDFKMIKGARKEPKKRPSAQKFNIVRRGYSPVEVEKFLEVRKVSSEQLYSELKKQAEDIKRENMRLNSELENFKSRENEIKESLLIATTKSNEMLLDLKLQYALEIERLKIFQAKWTNAYETLGERYHFEKDTLSMENVVINSVIELEKHLANDFGLKRSASGSDAERQFKSETERLLANSEEMQDLIEKLKSEIEEVGKKKGAFNIDDILNNKDIVS